MKLKKYILLAPSLILFIIVTSSYVFSKTTVFNPSSNIDLILVNNSDPYFKKQLTELKKKLSSKENDQIRLNKIKKTLSNESWMLAYNIQKFIPNKIKISIKPKEVIAIYVNKDGTTIPIGADGIILPKGSFTKTPIAPVIQDKKILDNKIDLLTKLMAQIPDSGEFSRKTIEQISLDKNKNILFHIDKMKIKINNINTAKKISRINATINYLNTRQITDCVIDADLTQKVLVRLNSPI